MGAPISAPVINLNKSGSLPSRIALGIFGNGPIKSITNRTIKVATGERTCPAIGINTIAVPNPENPLTKPANTAPRTK